MDRTQIALEFLWLNDVLDKGEFALLYDTTRRKNPIFPYWQYPRFSLHEISNDECRTEFRFDLNELPRLAAALRIPQRFTCSNRTVASGMEGLCILLKRFAYPNRFSDMIPRFGRCVPELCEITLEVLDFVYLTHGHLIHSLDQPWLHPAKLQEYADAVHEKGSALPNCWGFIDGTVRPICRPGKNQKVLYNGHKRVHAIKFQSVVAANGLIANLYGPVGKALRLLFINMCL